MKLTVILLAAVCLHVSANGIAQSVTFSGEKVPLKTVLDVVRKQTGYVFVSRKGILENAQPVTVSANNVPLKDFLTMILRDQALTYSISPKTIIISQRINNDGRSPSLTAEEVWAKLVFFPVQGVVRGSNGEALPGVTVAIKGKKTGVSSDENGRFTIDAQEGDVLIFSFVGFESQEVKVTRNTPLNITLKQATSELSETVVVGYGTMRRKDLTGSVASVNVQEVRNVPFATFDNAMTGKAAGVQVIQSDGSPGGMPKIRIRGGTSLLGGNDPLYIIDGIPVTVQNRYQASASEMVSPTQRYGDDDYNSSISGSFARGLNSLAGLNINDIESIDILKDASATAIYGSRAANGVVIITTRRGRANQKPTFEANYYAGMSKPIKEKVLNAAQYTAIMKESAKNLNEARAAAGLPESATANSILNDPSFLGTADTDWLDLVLRNGFSQNADISVRGGGNSSRYFTSLGYTKQNGTVLGTDFQRISGRLSLDNDITSKFSVNTSLNYGFTTNNITNGIYSQAFFMPPTLPAYNEDGSVRAIQPGDLGAEDYEGFQSPLSLLKGKNRSNTVNLLGSLTAGYDFLPSLKFRSMVTVNYVNYNQDNYIPSTALISVTNGTTSSPGVATQANSNDINLNVENTLTWDKQFNENHKLTVLGGTSWQKTRYKSFSASGQGFPDDEYLNNLSSAAIALPPAGTSGQNTLLSFYLRANYAFKERYLVTFTGRSDISSKFPKNTRTGYFPSAGVAWVLSEEKFLSKVPWISMLKLRASAGYTGTQNLSDNMFYTLYSPVSYGGVNGLVPSQLGNPDLKWENTFQKDLGLDISLFNARLNATLGYYEKRTDGILFNTTVANSSGFSSLISNIADIRNRGYELDLRGDVIKSKNFQWTGALNISRNVSKVLAISNDLDAESTGAVRFGNGALQVGQPLGLLYGKEFVGILRTQKEVDEYKAENFYAGFVLPYTGIGDARYKSDETGFYKDTVIGKGEPKFFGGFTNTFTYKNLSLSALLTYSYGGEILYLADAQNYDMSSRKNKGARVLDHYSETNPNSNNPRLLYGQSSYAYIASNAVHDASYIRLKSVTLNYQFSESMLSRLRIKNASVYVSAINLFTITNYPGADPEVSSDPYSIIGGYTDSGGYPTIKQYNVGVRFGF